MLTNRNCKNIQHGADFAKTFLGQQCCHAGKVFLTLETEEEKGGWYNKVQTEMYKWDPEVCGFGLSPKRAENVIQINISTLRKEVGKVNKQRWIDYTQAIPHICHGHHGRCPCKKFC